MRTRASKLADPGQMHKQPAVCLCNWLHLTTSMWLRRLARSDPICIHGRVAGAALTVLPVLSLAILFSTHRAAISSMAVCNFHRCNLLSSRSIASLASAHAIHYQPVKRWVCLNILAVLSPGNCCSTNLASHEE